MATRTLKNTGGNWNAAGTWQEGAVPTAADDVVINNTSGSAALTVNVPNAVCRSFSMLISFTGSITFNVGATVSIGDGTAGASNRALLLLSGSGYTLTFNGGTPFKFISTSSTQQTVNFNGKTITGSIEFNGVGGSWALSGMTSASNTGVITLTRGALSVGSNNVTAGGFSSNNTNTRTLTVGTMTFTLAGTWAIDDTNLTSSITSLSVSAGSCTLAGSGLTYNSMALTSPGANSTIGGSNTFGTLSFSPSGVNRTMTFAAGSKQTVSSSLTLQGSDGFLLNLVSDTPGTPWKISVPATQTLSYLSVADSDNSAGVTAAAGSTSTNGGGNTNWTFGGAVASPSSSSSSAVPSSSSRSPSSSGSSSLSGSSRSSLSSRSSSTPVLRGAVILDVAFFGDTPQTFDVAWFDAAVYDKAEFEQRILDVITMP